MAVVLDHILLAVPDLDAGAASFAALTGVVPVTGGSHPGFGTRNKLVSLGDGVFLELIAPDPAQPHSTTGLAAQIAALPHPAVLTFAVQTTDLDHTCAAAMAAGLRVGDRVAMSRTRPDGVRLDWTIVHLALAGDDQLVPFAIDWRNAPHPSGTTPRGCALRSLTVLHPDPAPLREAYAAIGLDVAVQAALRPGFVVVLDAPNGAVCLLGA